MVIPNKLQIRSDKLEVRTEENDCRYSSITVTTDITKIPIGNENDLNNDLRNTRAARYAQIP